MNRTRQDERPVLTSFERLFQGLTNYWVLAISGHRDLLTGDTGYLNGQEGRLEKLVRIKLETILAQQQAAGHSGIVIISPLAEGADCLVAWVVLQLQQQNKPVELRVVLPYNINAYESTLDEAHRQLIYRFINQAGGYAVLPTYVPASVDLTNPDHKKITEEAYRNYCKWLTKQADAALVL